MSLRKDKLTEKASPVRITVGVRRRITAVITPPVRPDIAPGQAALVCPELSITVIGRMNGPWVPTGGLGGFEFEDSPRNEQTTHWKGFDGLGVTGSLILDGDDTETRYGQLQRLGAKTLTGQPPYFAAYGNFTGTDNFYVLGTRPEEQDQLWIGTRRRRLQLGLTLMHFNPPTTVPVTQRKVAA